MISKLKEHMTNSLYQNTYVIFLFRGFVLVSGFVFWALAANRVSAEQIGLASGIIVAANFIAGISQMGIGIGLVRYLPRTKSPGNLFNLGVRLVGFISVAFSVVYLLTVEIWFPAMAAEATNLGVLILFLVLASTLGIMLILNWTFLGKKRPIFLLYRQILSTSLSLILVWALTSGDAGFFQIVVSFTVANLAGVIFAILVFLPIIFPALKLRINPGNEWPKEFWRYSLSNHVTQQFIRAPMDLMPVVIINLVGADKAAYFFVAWMIAGGLNNLASSVAAGLFAEGVNDVANVDTYFARSWRLGLVMAVGLTGIVGLLSKAILGVYGSNYVENGWILVLILLVANVPNIMFPIYINYLRTLDKLSTLVWISGGHFVLGVGMVWVFTSKMGLIGAGLGWLLSRVIVLVMIMGHWSFMRFRERTDILEGSLG